MTTPYLISSKKIRTDGIYYCIRNSYVESRDLKIFENKVFNFSGIVLTPTGKLFTFSESFLRNLSGPGFNNMKNVFEIVVQKIQSTRPYFWDYEISYNAHNLTANYSTNQLRVEQYVNHLDRNFIEYKGDNIHDFMLLNDIQNGISQPVENSLYPKKKRWWEI